MKRKFLQLVLKYLSIIILAKYKPKIVAITGSVGKSSAKAAVWVVLDFAFPDKVRASQKNLNTEIGVPLTIIGGEDAQRNLLAWAKNVFKALKLVLVRESSYPKILILEMAADKPSDIAYLTSFIYPDVAIVTAIGEMPVHLEFFPERVEYINEKANVLKALKLNGTAILNYDDLSVRELRDRVPTSRARIYYGFEAGAEIRLTDFSYNIPTSAEEIKSCGMDFKIEDRLAGESVDFKIKQTLGLPALYAALAGAAVGRAWGIGLKNIVQALANFKQPDHRLQVVAGIKSTILLDDAYNSSPLACEAALEVLSKFKKNRKVAVLGSMLELGINTESAHRLIGRKAARVADILFLVGDEMIFTKEEAEKIGFKLGRDLFWFAASDVATKEVERVLQLGDVVLIKGSRGVKMEQIVEEIRN